MKVINIIISLLLVAIVVYTLYIFMCEVANKERFENPEDGVMIVYGYSPQDETKLKYRKEPGLIISTKQFAYVPEENVDELKATDAYPIYNLIGVTKDNQVVNTISHMFTTGKGRVETDSSFIPVKSSLGYYGLIKIGADNKKYILLADIGEVSNGRAVSWYDFADEERAMKEFSNDMTRWSPFFDIRNDGIEVMRVTEDGTLVPSGWIMAVNSQNHIVLNSKEQGNKGLLDMDIMIKESGERKMVTLGGEVYLVNMERFSNVADGVLTEHVMKSEKVELAEGMTMEQYVTTNMSQDIPYAILNTTYPYAVKLEKPDVVFVNVSDTRTTLKLEEIDSKYQEHLKELFENREELVARANFKVSIEGESGSGEISAEVKGESVTELAKVEQDEKLVNEMKVTKEPAPQFEGIYISGGVASSFFENAFGSFGGGNKLNGSSLSEVQQRVLLNPTADTAKLHNQEVVKQHQEYNNGTCEYQLTKPQSCNQYDTPCPKPSEHNCYQCGNSPCSCKDKAAAQKYYKPYMG
jgi:hypothetical protein